MKVLAFLTDGFETVEALAVIDVLRRAKINVITVSITGDKLVESAQNIKVQADSLISEIKCEKDDVMLLITHNNEGGRIAAICAAPSVIGRLGMLKGKKATCFPGFEEMLKGAELACADVRVVTDGNITTSRGMGTSIDLGLELVRLLEGRDEADRLAHSTQYVNA